MNKYEELLALAKIEHHNMRTLHQYIVNDAGFFSNHPKIAAWCDAIGEQLDDLTETAISLGYHEPSLKDAVLNYGNDLLSIETRGLKETMYDAKTSMLRIMGAMREAETDNPPFVVNKLQEYQYFWNKEANYKVKMLLEEKNYDDDE